MKKIALVIAAFSLILASCDQKMNREETQVNDTTQVAARDGVFYHISSGMDSPHNVVMALKMANLMAEDHDVLVYFDIKGIEVVLNDAEDISYPTFPTANESLQKLLDKGIIVFACPSCLEAAGKSEADLRQGVKIANKDAFFGFTKGRILTLDY